jgi:hypothetical protein
MKELKNVSVLERKRKRERDGIKSKREREREREKGKCSSGNACSQASLASP